MIFNNRLGEDECRTYVMQITESQLLIGYSEYYKIVRKRGQAFELSPTERMFFRDAIRTLQTWEIVKKEYAELELIRKISETEIYIFPLILPEVETDRKKQTSESREQFYT